MVNIKELRKAKKLTQIQVAIAVGVSMVSVQLWERGVMNPSDENLKKLKEVLEYTE